MAANWSGGRWRADSFLHQGMDHRLHWSERSSSSPVVLNLLMMKTPAPRSSPGTLWPSPGNLLETLLWRDTPLQSLPFQLHLYNVDYNLVRKVDCSWSRTVDSVTLEVSWLHLIDKLNLALGVGVLTIFLTRQNSSNILSLFISEK